MVDILVKLCPRFPICSVNNCPLSADYPGLSVAEDDPEKRCRLSRPKRIKIAEGSKLRFKGMTLGEFHAQERWNNLPESEKEVIRQRASNLGSQTKKITYSPLILTPK